MVVLVICLNALLVTPSLWGLTGVDNNLVKCMLPCTETIKDKELEQEVTAEGLHNHFDKVSRIEEQALDMTILMMYTEHHIKATLYHSFLVLPAHLSVKTRQKPPAIQLKSNPLDSLP